MKTTSIHSAAPKLGPFLTLILLASPERGRAAREALGLVSTDVWTSSPTPSLREEVLSHTGSLSVSPAGVGPFLSLILNSGRSAVNA